MKQLAHNLFAVSGKGMFSIPIFVLEKSNGNLTIIDAGLAKDSEAIIKKINKKWGSFEKVERIVFTHRHGDHVQGLYAFLDEMVTISAEAPPEEKIELVTHEAEAPMFADKLSGKKIKPNRLVKHEEIIDKELKLKAIHTPGHTFGHLCLLIEDSKILLLGDLIMNMPFSLRPVFKRFHDNYEQYLETLPVILDFDWEYAVTSHMRPSKISRKKIEKFIKKHAK
ncbi:MAG: MBL fold metallo-hydrolase [Asgard group archaeon]|nr:MBL fold metallo-hydrolase [Asgard group archaeon]